MTNVPGRFGRALRTGWDILGITVLLVVGVELASLAVLRIARPAPHSPDFRMDADAYAGEPWSRGYYEEDARLRSRWNPYTYWRMSEFSGDFINVDADGRRVTFHADDNCNDDEVNVFMFGGSTLWGTGVRDDQTIASLVARYLERVGIHARVINYGEIGYVTTQEAIELMLELREGRVPDIAVFYDGINDVASAYYNGAPGLPHNEYRRSAEFNLLSRHRSGDFNRAFAQQWLDRSATVRLSRALARRLSGTMTGADAARLGHNAGAGLTQRVADTYRGNVDVVNMLAEQYGFDVLFYLQPVIFNKRAMTPYEQEQFERAAPFKEFFESCYAAINGRAADATGFRDISALLAGEPAPCFVDFMHLGEAANATVAAAIAEDVLLTLRDDATFSPLAR